MRFATRLMESASATEDPPNFWTTRLMGRFPSRLRTGGVERAGLPRAVRGRRQAGPGRIREERAARRSPPERVRTELREAVPEAGVVPRSRLVDSTGMLSNRSPDS